ncbi:MAG TPA: EAL domain-containing protein [Candidatus Butyricicoccus avistercoris]|uniref:EAL domain-containing protein n=1 Tax=Candidatus Butyricicoccus avistercoris TaxID=2838518 RepID=A0A9D1PIQ0_9FIRM|nr:EAL domain-containing protein [Candidatus Butyricicoccus avistercoris]
MSNDKKIKKKLLRYTVFMIIVGTVLIVSAVCIVYTSKKAENNSHVAYVNAILGEYKLNFSNKIESDLSTLVSVADMIEQGYISKDDIIKDVFTYFPKNSEFEKIGYYSIEAENKIITLDGSNIKYEFSNSPEKEKQTIRSAWQGNQTVSEVYTEDGKDKICYAVPVYEDGKVDGAITANIYLDKFVDIINANTLDGIKINIAWVNKSGDIIEYSEANILQGKRADIIKKAWSNKESFQFTSPVVKKIDIVLEKDTYPLYSIEIGHNGWSIVYIDSEGEVISPVYSAIFILVVIFMLLILFCFLVMLYTFKYIKNDKKTILSLADYDQLTKVYNTGEFINQVEQLYDNSADYYSVILNFRHFQYINNIFGRNIADKILIRTADILKSNLATDELVCRYRSDEFCMLLKSKDKKQLKNRILNIMDNISGISAKLQNEYAIKLYCGVSFRKADKQKKLPIADMLNEAEFALKTIKQGYDNNIAFYDSSVKEKKIFQNEIESSMEQALRNNEFKLFLQPKKNLLNNEIIGAEALVRWIKPDGKMIFPDEFIPLFEANGFCASLDLYMVDKVCALQRKWLENGKKIIPISVNQSKILFYRKDYIKNLCNITQKYGIDNKYIVLEILEGLVADDIETLNHTIAILREKGFQISMDDFGSGYSSLNTFTSIALDEIKLDKVFLRSIGTEKEQKQKQMMENIISIAKSFGIRTVTEGVETQVQETFLKSISCDYGQGYLYSKPISIDEFEEKYIN